MGIEVRPELGGGITKLSELIIDAAPTKAKDIVELILTTQGDQLYRDTVATRLASAYGSGYNFLHTKNTGKDVPEWMDILDIIIFLTGAVNRMIAPPTLVIPIPTISSPVVAEDHSGGANPAVIPALTLPVPTVSDAAAATSVSAVGGAVAHDDDGVDTDETTEANEGTANDMTLLQGDGAIADWYALGHANLFDGVVLKVSTVGVDITLGTLEYSKGGGTWGTLTPIMNELNNYETLGKRYFTFERPGDWAVDTYAGVANKYWIKFKASVIGGGFVQPLGEQAWILAY